MNLVERLRLVHENLYGEDACPSFISVAANRIEALEAALREARFALEPFADIKPRMWKTDMERAIRTLDRINEVLK